MGPMLFHLTDREAWKAALSAGEVVPASLAAEGFAHCSTAEQLAGVVGRFYAGRDDLLVLAVRPDGLDVRWEAPVHPDGRPVTAGEVLERFPHVYGPIPLASVAGHAPLPLGGDVAAVCTALAANAGP